MERELALEFARVTEAAALASSRWMGRGDRDAADNAAVRAMRAVFDTVNIAGTVVIGEGERDEAPMLYIGEKVGMGKSPVVDVAVDPLEGTNIVAKGLTGSISVLAVAPKDCLLHAPDIYMDKIAVGPRAKGKIDLDAPVADNLKSVSEALCKSIDDLTVVILDRPRHKQLIKDVREAGARIRLISDGDVSPAVATAYEDSGVDLMMGIGGAPEGVLAAAALVCLGGDMQARLAPENDEDRKRIHQMGTVDEDKLLMLDDLVKGDDVIFVATGITDGSLLKGVRYRVGGASTYTIVMRSQTGTVRYIEAWHKFAKKPLIDKIQGSCD
jgi:fructose-1,6-bisphosphatase II